MDFQLQVVSASNPTCSSRVNCSFLALLRQIDQLFAPLFVFCVSISGWMFYFILNITDSFVLLFQLGKLLHPDVFPFFYSHGITAIFCCCCSVLFLLVVFWSFISFSVVTTQFTLLSPEALQIPSSKNKLIDVPWGPTVFRHCCLVSNTVAPASLPRLTQENSAVRAALREILINWDLFHLVLKTIQDDLNCVLCTI